MGPLMRVKNNELIAKFMEVETCSDDHVNDGHGPCYWVPAGMFGKWEYVKDYGLKYDSSYEWLMPVVNKCINIYHDKRDKIFDALMSGEGIDKLYIAVVEFIQWYYDPESRWIVANGYPAPAHKKHTI